MSAGKKKKKKPDPDQLADQLHGEAAPPSLPREGETIGVGPDEPTQVMSKIPRETVEQLRKEIAEKEAEEAEE